MEELRPWTISILSTAYDLEEYRKAVIDELKSKGITVSAFELSEFPAEHSMHSHDSCLVALQRADIAILIINKRVGGQYYSEDKKSSQSITAKECSEAIKAGIPIYTFVKEEAWNERHAYKTQLKAFIGNSEKNSEEINDLKLKFNKDYICSYVDKVETIDFIESMQYAYEKHKISNWIDKFNTVEDLVNRVIGKLKGYSRKLIERIAAGQCSTLQNKHTSTAFGMTLGDVFKSQYYIEPPHEVESGDLGEDALSGNIHKAICSDKSVLIYGEAGYGKTTILAKCFIDHVEEYLKKPTYDIPLLLTLRNKGSDYHFNLEQFINEELAITEDTQLRHKPYPYLDLSQIRTRFYCDGFDEMAEMLNVNDLDRIRDSNIFTRPLLLTCRQQFANRYLRDPSFSDKFGIRVRINKWDSETVQNYIDNYFKNSGIDDNIKKNIYESMDKNIELHQVLDSPLLITMFLWYIEQQNTFESTITVTELFKHWISELAIRERSKVILGDADIDANKIVEIWAFTAWQVYCHKFQKKDLKLKLDDLIDSLKEKFPAYSEHINPSWFSTLFDCKNDYILGTFHEQFMEYLVAKVLIYACIKKEYPYPEFLKMVIRPEINRYFRGIWNDCNNRDKETVFSALEAQYTQNLGNNSQEAIASRVHAIYHISRLESLQRRPCLERAFNTEQHISVLLSLYFGAIKMGLLDKEETFFKLLNTDENFNKANRGYHLAYYSDSIVGDELPFEDDISCSWTGTLKAFERHFSSDDACHYFLRRIDLVTMRQLIEARAAIEPLTEEKLKCFEENISNSLHAKSSLNKEFNQKVIEEYGRLVETYNRFDKKAT